MIEDNENKGAYIGKQKAEKIINYFGSIEPRLQNTNTIIRLLEYLSEDKNYISWNKEYICDPEAKFESKLREHSSLFKNEYLSLLPNYKGCTEEAKKSIIQEGIRAKKYKCF